MFQKRYAVKILLNLHAITCPGVWLCSHGYLEATIKTLGYYLRTGAMEPRFPLLCHDQFTMEGYFRSVGSRHDVQRLLTAEHLEITLWQNGRRLAHFVGKLSDVMPGIRAGADTSNGHETNIELLMKAKPAFPGIIAPKVTLSSDWSIRDRSLRRGSSVSLTSDTFNTYTLDARPLTADEEETKSTMRQCCGHSVDEGHGRRLQKPVCHTKQHICQLGGVSTKFTDCHQQRRLSTCSSHLSSNTMLSRFSTATPSYCCHSYGSAMTAPTHASAEAADAHQRHCPICQKYREIFS